MKFPTKAEVRMLILDWRFAFDLLLALIVVFLVFLISSKDANAASANITVGVTFIEAFEVLEDDKQTSESNVEKPIVVIELDENGEEIITYIFQ